ncbi:glycosyltransferase family 2 protein [Psychroserpens algicola]|uniref:Glycosyltransferase family 2 protein n=1 Tax=Psychroserpens algicola TaxID=1719034 RepID=A0ABT0H5K8_9FLAO|nr:glycosyltransferase family 2 protein [Psychroserpens algicola]MCK8479646.1 glycosyltransferase family 2 protein [Psychroserpens algicola]
MQLSVVILNYNVCHFLELCLRSVEAALVQIDAEIIVVDNLSQDDSCTMVKRQFPKVKLIENSENYGFSKGNNIGVAQAKGNYICILNPDTVVAEDTFERLLKFSEAKKNSGIVGCRLIDGQGRFLPESKRHIPKPLVAVKKMLGISKSYYVSHLDDKSIGQVSVLVGAFMLLPKAVYDQVNGFDEDYFMYGEDIDLSYKVTQAGYTNLYNGEITAIHYKGESTLKDKTYAKRFYGAMQIFYNKHFKSNIIFDILVWSGIKIMPLIKGDAKNKKQRIDAYKLVSSEMNMPLKKVLAQDITLQSHFNSYENNTEYILDNNQFSFKSIIQILSDRPKNCSATFKILPKNSNFILGSNDSKSRGEVITFKNN